VADHPAHREHHRLCDLHRLDAGGIVFRAGIPAPWPPSSPPNASEAALLNSGQQALELLRRDQVDLLITDQAMPHMTGVELVKTIRAEQPNAL
jgi:CheY-like chemotaxis protein